MRRHAHQRGRPGRGHRAGCEFLRSRGTAALDEDVDRLEQGRFIHRDFYLLVLDLHDGVFSGHGNNPGRLGKGPEVRDVDGKGARRTRASPVMPG